jgi:hypothetical protein
MLTKNEIIKLVMNNYHGLVCESNWGETCLFYNPEKKLKKGVYLLTFKEKDGKNDNSSQLKDKKGFYRLNLGITKRTFLDLFGHIPTRPVAGKTVDMGYDFSTIDCIMPHPIYSWMAWICVVNPSQQTLKKLLPLIDEGYNLCVGKYNKKKLPR